MKIFNVSIKLLLYLPPPHPFLQISYTGGKRWSKRSLVLIMFSLWHSFTPRQIHSRTQKSSISVMLSCLSTAMIIFVWVNTQKLCKLFSQSENKSQVFVRFFFPSWKAFWRDMISYWDILSIAICSDFCLIFFREDGYFTWASP